MAGQVPNCGSGPANAQSVSGIASLGSLGSPPHWDSVYGPVRRDVTRISMELSDGAVLDLHPFASSGLRWIGLVIPGQLRMVEAIAYSGKRELGYSIPFTGKNGSAWFGLWLRPGQTGPARVTRLIGSGVAAGQKWSVVGYAGPWGYCDVLRSPHDASATCSPVTGQGSFGFVVDTAIRAAPYEPRWLIGTAPPAVVYLRLTMSDRSVVRVPVVELAGVKRFALALTSIPRVVRWGAYDSAGREVLGGQGPIDHWKPKK